VDVCPLLAVKAVIFSLKVTCKSLIPKSLVSSLFELLRPFPATEKEPVLESRGLKRVGKGEENHRNIGEYGCFFSWNDNLSI